MEKVFNLFFFIEGKLLEEIGYVTHELEGDDEFKSNFLRKNVEIDYLVAKRQILPSPIHIDILFSKFRLGTHLELFEDIFKIEYASISPLSCCTLIDNGKPRIDETTTHAPFSYQTLTHDAPHIDLGIMPDYLVSYMTKEGFDIPRLINDDYFQAIKLLFNNGLFVSSAKLLFSCIDTIGYIEFGIAEDGVFKNWLDKYANLETLGITAQELWELRNSLLHMSTNDSRKVVKGVTKRVTIYISSESTIFSKPEDEYSKYLNLRIFISIIAEAIRNWIESYNNDRLKLEKFISNYDKVVSDSRTAILNLKN